MNPINANVAHFLGTLYIGEHVKVISDIVEMAKGEVMTVPEAQSHMVKLEEAS